MGESTPWRLSRNTVLVRVFEKYNGDFISHHKNEREKDHIQMTGDHHSQERDKPWHALFSTERRSNPEVKAWCPASSTTSKSYLLRSHLRKLCNHPYLSERLEYQFLGFKKKNKPRSSRQLCHNSQSNWEGFNHSARMNKTISISVCKDLSAEVLDRYEKGAWCISKYLVVIVVIVMLKVISRV